MKHIGSTLRSRQINIYVCKSCARQLRKQRRTYATTSPPRIDIYDVVCVGGGPAGLSLLTALRANPSTSRLKSVLIEASPLSITPITPKWTPDPTKFSNRCSSLIPASVSFLERIGGWKYIRKQRVQSYESMQVWDGVGGGRVEFDWPGRTPGAGDVPGGIDGVGNGRTIAVMNENVNLTNALLERLRELGGVEVLGSTKVETIDYGVEEEGETGLDLREWPTITLSSGRQVTARLLVGADGASSPVRHFADIESRGWDYERHGVVATLELEPSSTAVEGETKGRTAYQRFLPNGPIALLPLPGPYATLVWSTRPELAAHLKTLSPIDFLAMVNAAFRLSPVDVAYMHTLPSGQHSELEWRAEHTPFDPSKIPANVTGLQEGSIASFPLRFRHADTYIAPRIALVGDAAHTIHPLAGQGLNQGQGDVEALANRLAWATERGVDLGDMAVLEGYERERYAKNHVLSGVVDKLHKGFAVGSGPVVGLRSWGLGAVDRLGPVKGCLMERAAGR